MKLTVVVFRELSQHLTDGLAPNLVKMLKFHSEFMIITLVNLSSGAIIKSKALLLQ